MNKEINTIGWKEWLSLPELNIPAIKAKIDTGARTSALHTYTLEKINRNGKQIAKFSIHPLQRRDDIVFNCESEIIDIRTVKDSGGHEEERYFINTSVLINDQPWEIEISLTNRENMLFRMLLGRTALIAGGLSVDPSLTYSSGKHLRDVYTEKNK